MWKRFFLTLLRGVLWFGFSFRYRFTFKNMEVLNEPKHKKGGYLILPNHPAELDPILMMMLTWKKYRPHPLVVEHFYHFPGAKWFMDSVGAIPIPNFETSANQWKKERGDKAFADISARLKGGENFLIYPSGHLKRDSREIIVGSSFIANLVKENPDVNILMVRISGFWGSSFSRAHTGKSPDFWKVLLNGIWTILKNGFFFVPKRHVYIEFFKPKDDFPYDEDKKVINEYLQSWYNNYLDDSGNRHKEEPLKLISYSAFKRDLPGHIYALEDQSFKQTDIQIPQEVKDKINEKICEIIDLKKEDITPEKDLSVDLGLDSLEIANLYTFIIEEYNLQSSIQPGELRFVNDLYILAIEEPRKSETLKQSKQSWPEEQNRPELDMCPGETLHEVFLRGCDRLKGFSACSDVTTGLLTYDRLKLAALILADKIKNMPGKYIGIMLPSSIGVYLMIFATLLAKKVPVMMNWTAGSRSLNHGIDLLDIQVVLSSRKFLDRLEHLQLGKMEEKLLFIENVKKKISLIDKLKGLIQSKRSAKSLIRSLGLKNICETEPAVVLFTSGTEAYPKAVPLSHKNILANQRNALSVIDITSKDTIYGVLPPFHSFGFTVTGLLPILCGMKVYFAPDPTDAQTMVNDVEQWKISILCLAPSFYKNIFRLAKPKQLDSIRLFVSGAEKAPDELKNAIKQLGEDKTFIEGYGITECSPIVSLCMPKDQGEGCIGRAIPSLEICVIHQDTNEVLKEGEVGELCIHGPSVFDGYLGNVSKEPFIHLQGKKWYRSGDIGYMDQQGRMFLKGRLKRFVKIGGEMISLNAIEEELIHQSDKHGWMSHEDAERAFVVCAAELDNAQPLLVLFTTCKLNKEEVNAILRESGFGRVMKISDVKVLEEIPLTGTGKIHYRKLNEMLSEMISK